LAQGHCVRSLHSPLWLALILAARMMTSSPQAGPMQGQAVAGIAKNISWKILFFVAACCVLAAAVISIISLIFSFTWAPVSMLTQLFLLVFGLLMLVLDFPVPPNQQLAMIRFNIYKFLLFMTRFTGRGMWYLFLGTMVFAAMWDLEHYYFIGFVLSGYISVLGLVVLIFGWRLSCKLNEVRKALQLAPVQCPQGGFGYEGFSELARQANQTSFTSDELVYVFNGLSFSPLNDGVLTPDEYMLWLTPGRMEIV